MRKFKSMLYAVPAIIIAAAIVSCGGSGAKKSGDSTAAGGSDTSKKAASAMAVAVPFDVVDVIHTVKDYDKWRPVFDVDSTNRKAGGGQDLVVARNADSANNILVIVKVSDMTKARAMMADPKLKAAMDKGGVISKPDINFYHVIRFANGARPKQFVVVNHKVKDFNAWLKVYDGEGPAKRASEGMVDIALARGIDDTTMVHLAFEVTDMAKAKASMMSDDKKKLMMSAGVIGKPDIRFYNTAK
ncbi:MAG TPA: hypothetical protein VG367_01775 [Mucilaginibacter sp.]|jgi:hypothetical protein|nr:hypothetical protein [Mucilaginibacter sp.]